MSEHEFADRKTRLSNHRGKKARRRTDCWVDAYTRLDKAGNEIFIKGHRRGNPPADSDYEIDRALAALTAVSRRENASWIANKEIMDAAIALQRNSPPLRKMPPEKISKVKEPVQRYDAIRRVVVVMLRTLVENFGEDDLLAAGLLRKR